MIYDCFPAFNELELLEIRLHELANVVDRFVLVEATRTHSNLPKPLYFKENRSRFAPFADRIIHVVVEDMPDGPDAWVRENYQRNCIARGLVGAKDDDLILISDLDEIPPASVVRPTSGLAILQQRLSYYFLNYASQEPWCGTRMLPFGLLRQLPNIQTVRVATAGAVIPDAGWHFSYLGGVERIQQKIRSFAHQEFNTPGMTDPAQIAKAMRAGQDLYQRGFQQFSPVELRTLPAYVVENRLRYLPWLWSEFHEDWYSQEQCQALVAAYALTKDLVGDVIEVGCWEGRSTAYLANACFPEELQAVDTWQGNIDENPQHPTATIARQRNVHQTFLNNMRSLTLGNVRPHVMRSQDFFAKHHSPIKFCHIDASYDYNSVKAEIQAALEHLLPTGVLCGDDFLSAGIERQDLGGGVERAVRELLPGFQARGNFWYWQKPWKAGITMPAKHAKNPLNLVKNQQYFAHDRTDVLNLILKSGITARKVIELGCSSGHVGAKLKQALGVQEYVGVEMQPEAAAQAAERFDKVHVADLEKTSPRELGLAPGNFDLLLALDVLEHLHNPWDVLAAWVELLRPGGHVVVSIPNIQNIDIIKGLAEGRWEYERAGLLDVTHLRFFTRQGIDQLLTGAGLKVTHVERVLLQPPDLSKLQDTGNNLTTNNLTINNQTRDQVIALLTYQYLVIGQKPV